MKLEVEFGGIEVELKLKSWRGLITLAGLGMVAAAVRQELSRPANQRTWHGKLAGVVPYDFRPPTLERIKETFWDPDNPNLLTDRAFGIGWSVNFARLARPIAGNGARSTA